MTRSYVWCAIALCLGTGCANVGDGGGVPAVDTREAVHVATDASQVAPAARDDLATLEADLRSMAAQHDYAGPPIVLEYTGVGRVIDVSEDLEPVAAAPDLVDRADLEAAPTFEEDPDYADWTVVRVATGNEFRVRFPRELLSLADERGTSLGLNMPSRDADGPANEGDEQQLPTTPRDDGRPGPLGWSNGADTRSLLGTYDVAHTHTAYRKLVHLSNGCSGTLVGPRHIITAAHCLRNEAAAAWVSATARAGRSGDAWRAEAPFSTSNAWYWTPSAYRTLSDGLADMPYSATPYDIAMVVTHSNRMGDVVGWMGWYRWNNDADFGNNIRYNRGYPGCGADNAPEDCLSRGLYGDSAWCASGDYSSPDSDGVNRRFRFHCDVSGGHSGSSLYTYLDGETLAVTSVVSWELCTTCDEPGLSASVLARPNVGVRITPEYSGVISTLRSMFP
jgi:V8-like Glu-specific endopeptidase